jgi:hypothetical protein
MPESPARRVSFSERLSETPQIANRAPTAGQDRAPAMYSDPTSGSIRARLKGQVPTGPTFHSVWRVVRRRLPHIGKGPRTVVRKMPHASRTPVLHFRLESSP